MKRVFYENKYILKQVLGAGFNRRGFVVFNFSYNQISRFLLKDNVDKKEKALG